MTAESATTDAEPSTDASVAVCAEDILRADLYDFLAAFLARPPSGVLLTQAMSLEGDDSDLGRGIAAVARLAKSIAVPDAQREFNALFIGLGRGELIPHCSYYLTGFLNEKPLARLRGDM
ncbi:MAG: molecular chaperone TorD family protein, partial [Rhizobiales bacterium]|nr:molecular chaperone TorD family protein [Hyphomicrobiales bacterium]